MIGKNILHDQAADKERQKIVEINLDAGQKKFLKKEWGLQNSLDKVFDNLCLQKYEELIKYQQELAKQEECKNYILGIHEYRVDKNKKQITINYNCSEDAKSLLDLYFCRDKDKSQQDTELQKLNTYDQKSEIFNQLIKLSEFLKNNNNKIIHNNIKPSNIIFDNNQLYLTDFGYNESDKNKNGYNESDKNKNPFIFKDCLNLMRNRISPKEKEELYPYLESNLLEAIKEKGQEEMGNKLKTKTEDEAKRQDQLALGVMMLGLFHDYQFREFKDKFGNEDQNYIKFNKPANKMEQISNLKHFKDNLKPDEVGSPDKIIAIIQEILKERFSNYNQLPPDFPRTLSIFKYKINKSKLMKKEIYEQAQGCLQDNNNEFDLNLLYYLSKEELKHKSQNIREYSSDNFQKKLKEKINKLLKIYNNLDKLEIQNFDNDLKVLNIEDQVIALIYLDQKIEDFKLKKYYDEEETKKLLEYYKLKGKCEKFYQAIDNTPVDNFKFNNIQKKESQINQNINENQFDIILNNISAQTFEFNQNLKQASTLNQNINNENEVPQNNKSPQALELNYNQHYKQASTLNENIYENQLEIPFNDTSPQEFQTNYVQHFQQEPLINENTNENQLVIQLQNQEQIQNIPLQEQQQQPIQENSQQIIQEQFFATLQEALEDLPEKPNYMKKRILKYYLIQNYFEEGYQFDQVNDSGDKIQIKIKNLSLNIIQTIQLIKENVIIHEIESKQYQKTISKQYQVLKFTRHFEPFEYFIFELTQQSKISDSKIDFTNFKKNITYTGQYDIDLYNQSKEIQFKNQGTLEILDKNQLTPGEVCKIQGNFTMNKADGIGIKTYFYYPNQRQKIYCVGQYKNGQMKGLQTYYENYPENDETRIKSTYHFNFFNWFQIQLN